jgi:serine/threonine-protein kinase
LFVRTSSDLCGRVLDARYRVDRVVATGGMGTVYEGFDNRLERVVAVKVMNDNLLYEPGFTDRFVTEARAAARLSDPHVVAVYDRGRSADAVYLVMEYVPGRTLRRELTFGGRIPVARALDILTAVLKGLQAAHSAGFVHGDIKPENVLLGDRGEVKVTDFGLARAIEDGDHRASLLMGTAAYLAPEQASDRTPDPRSDLYSTGILLFEMLTGHVPFRADSPDDVLSLHQTQRVPDPSTFIEVESGIDDLCERATAKNPADRFQTATEMLIAVSALRRAADPGAAAPPLRSSAAALPPVVATVPDTLVVQTELVPPAPEVHPVPEPPTPPPSAPAVAVVPPAPPGAPEPAAVKRRRPRRALGLLLLAVLAGIVGYVAWNLGTTETVNTPKLAGMSRSEALNALEQAGLTMKVVDEQYSEKRDAGTIISSEPGAGEKVAVNGTVAVVMSKGPERYRVPKVRGLNQEAATQALEAVNLRTGQILQDYSRKVTEGQVMRTNPPVGTPLKRDTEVALTISLGPEPVVVPDVSNLTVSEAQATLSGAGLKSRTVEQFDETVPFGRVIGTEPSSGTTAYRGDKVRLLVSKGSQYVAVPSVIGLDTETATARLQDAGFRVATEEQFGVTIANRVLSQDPSGGTEVASGTLVTLTIT